MKIRNWKNVWRFGANFIPSTAINQLEMWQEETFDPETIDRELGYAEKIGMNIMRVYLHDLLWEQDAPGFLRRMEKYLEIADSHHIGTMFVFFDDCWNPEFTLGKQPAPAPYTHNSGWIQSPGNAASDDLSQRPRLERYVKGVLSHFAHDGRIVLWDLYNEPGNGKAGDHLTVSACRENLSLPLLKDVFRWANEVERDQPVTAAPWAFREGFGDLERFSFEHSEVVSFHCYCGKDVTERTSYLAKLIADGRPVICSEYMARTADSTFADCLPVFKKFGIGAINWGLVSGKTQTVYPWGWSAEKGQPPVPFHDVFNPDGSFLVPEEEKAIADIVK